MDFSVAVGFCTNTVFILNAATGRASRTFVQESIFQIHHRDLQIIKKFPRKHFDYFLGD